MCVIKIVQGDALALLNKIPSEFVHCVVTSPPYWGLRDYGVTGQLGLEPTFQEYIDKMVGVFREVRRVLRKDGTLWLNMGDSYSGYHGNKNSEIPTSAMNGWTNGTNENLRGSGITSGLKPKDLCGIPWRLAFALQADGWWLRSDIIWAKPNPMPESVTDRPTKSHEYLFLMSKSGRYYYDVEAVREPHREPWRSTGKMENRGTKDVDAKVNNGFGLAGVTPRLYNPAGRNARTVWTIATRPYKGAHFATFPPPLVEPCIKAGAPVGSIVLDPFAGSGTVGMVAQQLGRHALLLELNPDYCEMAAQRCNILPATIMREQKEQKSHALFT